MIRSCILGLVLLLLTGTATADEPALDVVLVTGEQPGPALWKVTSGDHVLWILGDVAPLSRKMRWRSKQFERLLANSQEVILDYSGLKNLPKPVPLPKSVHYLPKGQILKDVISPDLYARVAATQKIFGNREKLDRLRPWWAASRIFMMAVTSMNLSASNATFAVEKLARKADVRITSLWIPGPTPEEHYRNVEFGATEPCLQRAVEVVEDGGNGMRRLANAWSLGDIDELRRLVPSYAMFHDGLRLDPCYVVMQGGELQARNYIAKRGDSWLSAAERALRDNQSTMAVVRVDDLFAPDGYLATLRAKGYEVVEPE